MKKNRKRVKKYYRYFKKSNFELLNRILRILSWLLPGLVIKRWIITSAIGFVTSLLGLAIWTNLRPLYWLIEVFFWLMTGLTSILPVSLLGPLIFVAGLLLIGLGQPIEIAPLRSSTSDILNLASVAAYSASVINYGKKN